MTATIDELKTTGRLARVMAAVLVGAVRAFVYAGDWLNSNRAPASSLVFSRGGDQVATQRGVDSLSCIAPIGPQEPYAPGSG
jgi:hypothetical protein